MTLYRAWITAGVSLAAALFLAGLLAWKPGADVEHQPSQSPLLVYCAASLKAPVETLARAYGRENGVPIHLQYGGSQTLLANLELSKRGDLYIPAEEAYVQMGREKHLVAETLPLGRMNAVLVVRQGNPKNVRSLGDLLRAEVRLAQANPDAAAIGKAVRETLQKTGQWEAVRQHTLVFKPTVNDVANDLKLGTVDAAFVWDVTVRQYPGLEIVPTVELAKVKARLVVAVAATSTRPAAALRFARYLTAPDKGLLEFARDGFETTAP